MAPCVTQRALLSFPGFMRLSGSPRLAPALVMLSAAAAASFLLVLAPSARALCGTASDPCPTPSPPPSPIPQNAFLSLDVTDGGPNTQITVNGGAFLPNEQMSLIWDMPNKVAGGAVADSSGNFVTHVKPFTGDAPGVHKLCASVEPRPCANFTLEAAATTPSPSPSPSESPSPSPTASTASPTTSPTPAAATLNGLDLISKPPFVFLPIAGLMAIVLSLGYWAVGMMRRPRATPALPSAAVVHRAMRPDYTAGFGTPPPTPAAEPGAESAWTEPVHPLPAAPPPPTAEPAPETAPELELPTVEWGPPSEWGPGTPDAGYPELSAPDEPPELPEHGDLPEPGD